MGRVFSNGPSKDFVINPFTKLAAEATRVFIAAPYVTRTDDLIQAARRGTRVDLLVGLNTATSPAALAAVQHEPNIRVRYYTHRRFHAKIYLFDAAAMVGSSNLTSSRVSTSPATLNHDDAGGASRRLRGD
jgi:phosphatidylserine/phosphatidylglycerophosphate/cardiolipin synthase-like enzyme